MPDAIGLDVEFVGEVDAGEHAWNQHNAWVKSFPPWGGLPESLRQKWRDVAAATFDYFMSLAAKPPTE